MLQSVMTGPMGTTVSTTVVATVWTTLHVTNRRETVRGDVNRDILIMTVKKVSRNEKLIWLNTNTNVKMEHIVRTLRNSYVRRIILKRNHLLVSFNCFFLLKITNIVCGNVYYGNNCSFRCALRCKTCQNTDGFCICKKDWIGLNCTEGKCTIFPTVYYHTTDFGQSNSVANIWCSFY